MTDTDARRHVSDLSQPQVTTPALSGDWGGQISGAREQHGHEEHFVGAKERIREISQMPLAAVRIMARTTADATTRLICRARLFDPGKFEELSALVSGYPRQLGDTMTLTERIVDAFVEWTNPSDVAVALKSTRRNVLQLLSARRTNGLVVIERRLTAVGEAEYRAVRTRTPLKDVPRMRKGTRGLSVAG